MAVESGPGNPEGSAGHKEQKIALRMRIVAVVVEVRVNRVAVAVAVDVTAIAGEVEERGSQAGAEIDTVVVLRVGRRTAMIAVDKPGGHESLVGTRTLDVVVVVESRSESWRGRMSAPCWTRRKCCRRSPKLADTELSRAGSKEN